MNWTKTGRATLAGLCLLGGAQAHAVGTLYAGFGGTSDGVSVRSSTTLTEIGSFGIGGGELTGIEAGESGNLYVTADDTISNLNLAGGVNASLEVAGAEFSDVALLGNVVFATATGATPGISARNLDTLVESDFFETTFTPTSIEDGFGRLYVTAGDTLFILNASGEELANASSGTAGVTFVGSALSGTRLYAATGGAQNGVSVRNPITLAEITSFTLPFAVEGVVAGDDDDLFIVSGANVFHYSTDGVELDSQVDSTTGRAFADIAFIADPRTPSAGSILAIDAAGGDSVSIRDAETLTGAGSFDVLAAATGVTLGGSDDVYLAAGDTLLRYGTDGSFIDSVTNDGAVYNDVAFVDGGLVVATTDGISVRDPVTLAETSSADIGFTPTSVAAADEAGEVYLTSLNMVARYTTAGVEQASFSGLPTFTFTDVALVNSVVYATYTADPDNGIAVLDPGSLEQSDVIASPIAATGIAAGGSNEYYISGDDTIVHFVLDEILSSTTVAGSGFPDVVFSQEGSTAATSVVAATLPGVRSVQVGSTASAFATIINTGQVTASDCLISPVTVVAADFTYQTTDPGTNELVGTQNQPADIASAGSQSFLITFTPTAAFNATDIELAFECANAPAAPSFPGLNTVLLVADDDPVPDVVALASTPTTPGVIDVPGVGGTGFFAVASVNVGAEGDIAVIADITNGDPSVTLSICETNPMTGACINPTTPTTDPVNTTIATNATPTFSIFAQASEAIALDPAGVRVRVSFTDASDGTIRGATSVAIRTQ